MMAPAHRRYPEPVAALAPPRPVRGIDDMDGWFRLTDQLVMNWLLEYQDRTGVTGDLLEMGAYLGKSTILIGFHRGAGERLVVCDLFGQEPPTEENRQTAAFYTENLTREAFEANYALFHAEPPEVIQAPTTAIPDRVPADSCRFVHIDACHLYDVVLEDIQTARSVLSEDGIVVFDDIRAAHTPGVPAAVWPEVVSRGLHPICLTPNKLYATWGDERPVQESLLSWLDSQEGSAYDLQRIADRQVIRVADWTSAPASPVPAPPGAPPPPRRWLPAGARRVAVDLLPPIVTRALMKIRHRLR